MFPVTFKHGEKLISWAYARGSNVARFFFGGGGGGGCYGLLSSCPIQSDKGLETRREECNEKLKELESYRLDHLADRH